MAYLPPNLRRMLETEDWTENPIEPDLPPMLESGALTNPPRDMRTEKILKETPPQYLADMLNTPLEALGWVPGPVGGAAGLAQPFTEALAENKPVDPLSVGLGAAGVMPFGGLMKWGKKVKPEVVDQLKDIIKFFNNEDLYIGRNVADNIDDVMKNFDEEGLKNVLEKTGGKPLLDIHSLPYHDAFDLNQRIGAFLKTNARGASTAIHRYSDATNAAKRLEEIDPDELRNSGALAEQLWKAGGYEEGVPYVRQQGMWKDAGDKLRYRPGENTFTSNNLALAEFMRGLSKGFQAPGDADWMNFFWKNVYNPKQIFSGYEVPFVTDPTGSPLAEAVKNMRKFVKSNPDYEGPLGFRIADKISPDRIIASYNTHPVDLVGLTPYPSEREIVEASKSVLERVRSGRVDPDKWHRLFYGADNTEAKNRFWDFSKQAGNNPLKAALNDTKDIDTTPSIVEKTWFKAFNPGELDGYLLQEGENIPKVPLISDQAKYIVANTPPYILEKAILLEEFGTNGKHSAAQFLKTVAKLPFDPHLTFQSEAWTNFKNATLKEIKSQLPSWIKSPEVLSEVESIPGGKIKLNLDTSSATEGLGRDFVNGFSQKAVDGLISTMADTSKVIGTTAATVTSGKQYLIDVLGIPSDIAESVVNSEIVWKKIDEKAGILNDFK